MQYRTLGRTGVRLSVIGFGGIVVMNETPTAAAALVAQAIARGITYFDVAPSYGNAEERLGPALHPYREQVFLACKTGKRDAAGAAAELQQSLRLLQTDYFDLYQFHGVSSVAEAEQILAPGGALEAFLAARDRGQVRHLGFSAHNEAAALHLLAAFPFASMLLPINRFCWHDGNFGPRVVAQAAAKGVGILALKALALRPWHDGEVKTWPKCWYCPVDTLPEARAGLAFTLAHPVTAALPPGHAELLWLACDAADALAAGAAAAEPEPAMAAAGAPIFSSPK